MVEEKRSRKPPATMVGRGPESGNVGARPTELHPYGVDVRLLGKIFATLLLTVGIGTMLVSFWQALVWWNGVIAASHLGPALGVVVATVVLFVSSGAKR